MSFKPLSPQKSDIQYHLASRKKDKIRSDIIVGTGDNKVIINDENLTIIAGPCSLESRDDSVALAKTLKICGANIFRGMIFKPRSSPYSFQGVGKTGIETIKAIKSEVDIPIVSEARNEREADVIAENCDLLQIGTRNMTNYQLLEYIGRLNIPILLKRGMGSTIEEWLCAAEYILNQGNQRVILCERGIRTFETATRFTLDIAAIPLVKELSHLPVIIDPSHASGKRSLVPPLSIAGVGAGANGIMIEVHNKPESAFSDAQQTVSVETFSELVKLAKIVSKTIKFQ
jgi:3-deoxy-7-phosphoheptulonate synthase